LPAGVIVSIYFLPRYLSNASKDAGHAAFSQEAAAVENVKAVYFAASRLVNFLAVFRSADCIQSSALGQTKGI
jgi:hypothetical protein